jgi:hypothetical protein
MKRVWFFIGLLFVASTAVSQSSVARNASTFPSQINIDSNSDLTQGGGENPLDFEPLGQSFTAVTSHIEWIGFDITYDSDSPCVFQVTLREGVGTSGVVVATQTSTTPPGSIDGFLYFDFSKTPLVVGSQYTALFSPLSTICGGTINLTGPNFVYPEGTAFSGGVEIASSFYFRVLTAVFAAQVQPPLNPDGSSTFKRGTVIPVAFTLTADGASTCNLPPAKIALRGSSKYDIYPFAVAPFKVNSCQYTFNLPTASLPPDQYIIEIFLGYSTPTALEVASVDFTVD